MRELTAALTPQVVDECQPVPRGDREDLMHAVRVEGGEGHLGGLRAAQLQPYFPVAVTHQEGTTGIERREHQDEGGKHPGSLLGIAMVREKTAWVVHQEFVE